LSKVASCGRQLTLSAAELFKQKICQPWIWLCNTDGVLKTLVV
jgi:hypothetical protein